MIDIISPIKAMEFAFPTTGVYPPTPAVRRPVAAATIAQRNSTAAATTARRRLSAGSVMILVSGTAAAIARRTRAISGIAAASAIQIRRIQTWDGSQLNQVGSAMVETPRVRVIQQVNNRPSPVFTGRLFDGSYWFYAEHPGFYRFDIRRGLLTAVYMGYDSGTIEITTTGVYRVVVVANHAGSDLFHVSPYDGPVTR